MFPPPEAPSRYISPAVDVESHDGRCVLFIIIVSRFPLQEAYALSNCGAERFSWAQRVVFVVLSPYSKCELVGDGADCRKELGFAFGGHGKAITAMRKLDFQEWINGSPLLVCLYLIRIHRVYAWSPSTFTTLYSQIRKPLSSLDVSTYFSMDIAKRDPVPIYARLGLIGSFLYGALLDDIPEELIASTTARTEFTTMMEVKIVSTSA